ncbi:MAG TPA: hypothetical protein VNS57_16600 [Steroidobacteraceae bacterium]|nr:hypothetical protein [Steroidobacteraceae bacterium]
MRIELFMSVLAGFAGGLCGTLWAGLVTMPLLARWPALRPAEPWQAETATRLLAGAALYGACGAAAGLLFWLGWGLVAVVSAPWPALGATYGGLLWLAGTLPALGSIALRQRRARGAVVVVAIEALVACLATGVLCAYVWQRMS